jgi:hypothetical protein
MGHEQAHVFGSARVEVLLMGARQVLGEVLKVIPVSLVGLLLDPGMVDFDRLRDQLVVRQFHPLLLDLVEETGRRAGVLWGDLRHRTGCPATVVAVSPRSS